MSRSTAILIFVSMMSLSFLACAVGSNSQVSVSELETSPPSLMVQRKSPLPVFLVLNHEHVPQEMNILVNGTDRGGTLTNIHDFVHRDLKQFFANYFEEVHVVEGARPDLDDLHLFVDVRLTRVEVTTAGTQNNVTYGYATLNWSLAMGAPGADDYLFSFASQSRGELSGTPNLVFRTMLESAISDLARGYTDREIHRQVLEVTTPRENEEDVASDHDSESISL